MALSKTVLRDLIISSFEEQFGKTPKKRRGSLIKMATAIADAVVEHITTAAEVNVNVSTTTTTTVATSASGLQRLPAVFVANADTLGPSSTKTLSGTGTGTGTGTVS